jgi:hypothetical protein
VENQVLTNLTAGSGGRAVWDIGLDRLGAEIVGSNPT